VCLSGAAKEMIISIITRVVNLNFFSSCIGIASFSLVAIEVATEKFSSRKYCCNSNIFSIANGFATKSCLQ
jgi:hypothetical protein